MKQALDKYLSHFERLQENKIDDLLSTVSENFTFEDPFQKIKGKSQFKALLKKMFKRLKEPKFKIIKFLKSFICLSLFFANLA